MDAAIWTLIALLGASTFGGIFYLGSRVDALSGRFDALADRMDTRFDRVDARFDALEARLDAHLQGHPS
jgi:hypothetical protein